MQALLDIDTALFFFVNQALANPVFDWVMPLITKIRNMAPLIGIAAIYLAVRGKRKGRIALIALVIAVAVSDLVSHELLKPFFGRLRPCVALEGVRMLLGKKTSLSFPSNHAANIAAAAVVVSFYYRRMLWPMACLAFLIAFSRVYVGVHYPGDVLFGALFGAGMAAAVLAVLRKYVKDEPGAEAGPEPTQPNPG